VSRQQAQKKNMLGFRARASGIVDLAYKHTNKTTAGRLPQGEGGIEIED
jgi:hypothetical protein